MENTLKRLDLTLDYHIDDILTSEIQIKLFQHDYGRERKGQRKMVKMKMTSFYNYFNIIFMINTLYFLNGSAQQSIKNYSWSSQAV